MVLNSNQFVSASFTQTAANVIASVVGSGAVTSNPAGINCPGTCTATFQLGTKVTLTATPASKISFFAWGGNCSGTSTCALTVNSNQNVTATFHGFTIAATGLSPSSVAPGGTSASTVTITGSGGFNPTGVTLGCTITPATSPAPTCQFGAISGGAATLTVATSPASSAMAQPLFHHSGILYAMFLPIGGMAFLGAGFGGKSRKNKLLGFFLVCLVLSGLMFLGACGSSSHGVSSTGVGGTPAGNYTITVTGTATGVVQGGNPPQLALTVQ